MDTTDYFERIMNGVDLDSLHDALAKFAEGDVSALSRNQARIILGILRTIDILHYEAL